MDMQKNPSVHAKKRTAIVLIDADVASVKLHLVFVYVRLLLEVMF